MSFVIRYIHFIIVIKRTRHRGRIYLSLWILSSTDDFFENTVLFLASLLYSHLLRHSY
jgi:hypothetical protein